MPQQEHLQVILAKLEVTYGTDPTPTGSANAILVRNISAPTPLLAEQKDRQLIRPYFANNEQLNANVHSVIEFDVELQASGTAGVAPAYAPLLLACGHAETIVADTSVAYEPISEDFDSATVYFYQDTNLHKMTGCRGTMQIMIDANEIPYIKFRLVGKYNPAAAGTLPDCDFSDFKKPLVSNNTNTTNFSFFSYSGVLKSFMFDINAQVDYRSLIGAEYVQYANRKPQGEVLIESPALGTKDFFAISKAETTGALTITHGTATGYKVRIEHDVVDIGNPQYEYDNGIAMLKIPYSPLPADGNDDYVITFL